MIEEHDERRAALVPQLWPGGAVKEYAYSALAHADFDALAERLGEAPLIRLRERSLVGLLSVRADADSVALGAALRAVLELELPGRLESATNGDCCIRWMSPDEWLLSLPIERTGGVESALRRGVEGHLALVDVSGGYALLELAGDKACEVLRKGSGYDVSPGNFPPGKVVGTTLAKSGIILRCVETDRYELIVRRSFADYLWLWLQRAVSEYRIG